jgi:phosphoglycolate phosphatase-like HAD superfamily hydrolase
MLFTETKSPDNRTPPYRSKIQMVLELIKTHYLVPEQVLLIGDTSEDAETAATCKTQFAAVDYGYEFKKTKIYPNLSIHYRFKSITDLLLIVES